MRISDWSSDVCSSDLFLGRGDAGLGNAAQHLEEMTLVATDGVEHGAPAQAFTGQLDDALRHLLQLLAAEAGLEREARHVADRQRVVEGKSVSVRVDPGGRRFLQTTTTKTNHLT